MSLRLRRHGKLVAVLALSIAASCSDSVTTSSSTLSPKDPNNLVMPLGCSGASCIGIPGNPINAIVAIPERLQVCKIYPDGTGPAVQVTVEAKSPSHPNPSSPDGEYHYTFTIPANTCRQLWTNGEASGQNPDGSYILNISDTVIVNEIVPSGYTTTATRITTRATDNDIRNHQTFSSITTTNAALRVSEPVGGFKIPGVTVIYYNRPTAR